jgi:Na+(H+)/acetate symporter ActP
VLFVLFIGFFYTMPQMKGAGVTLGAIMGWPYWVGILVVGTVITFNVAIGGMKGITLVQAFQYWVKLFAITVPLFVVMSVFGGYNENLSNAAEMQFATPKMPVNAEVSMKGAKAAPANALSLSAGEHDAIEFKDEGLFAKISPARKPAEGEDPIKPMDFVKVLKLPMGRDVTAQHAPAGSIVEFHPVTVTKGGKTVMKDGVVVRTNAKIEFAEPCKIVISETPGKTPVGGKLVPHGASAPNSPRNSAWLNPFGPLTGKWGYPLLSTYSLIIALVCGTAGLPHILVRFYTNPDGRAAKKTTLWVMVMLGLFYVFTPMWGAIARFSIPTLYASGGTDLAVINLPAMMENKDLGLILKGVTSAGAFAAFMSTFSGLLVSMSGAFAHDIYGKIIKPDAAPEDRLKAFKVAAIGVGVISMALGLLVESFDIAMMVGWAFAIGAASYFPLLLLGSWWRGLTKAGASAGMLLGGLLSLAAIVGHMLLDKKILDMDLPPVVRALMEQPAIWGVPLSMITMYLVSKATATTVPQDVDVKMLRLHAPEELGWSKNYIEG